MPRAKKAAKPLVTTVIPPGSAGHAFEKLEDQGALPILKSVGYARVFPGSREYVSYVITSQGREVLSIEVSEPNLKAIASDEAKISFVTLLEDEDQTLEEDLKHIEADKKAASASPA